MTEEQLDMPPPAPPLDILRQVFGYSDFRGHQSEIIDHTIAGRNSCVVMPTGSGKSLCYQIPAICRPGVGIVVSPLIALMDDQVVALRELGVAAAAIHSGREAKDISASFARLRAGSLDLLYVAPERLLMDDFLHLLDTLPIALFAIDEAHCISQWGHDFRPEYKQLSLLATRYPQVPRIAVTATADAPTRQEIMQGLALDTLFQAGFDRPNIFYAVEIKSNPSRQLLSFLSARPQDESGIIYCLSRKKTEEISQFLRQNGYKALPYHAGMSAAQRAKNQETLLRDEGVIMVATIAFGMGINKPDVRFVLHLDLPKSIEAYYQETGRAGRDGLPAEAWMIYGAQDVALRRQMIQQGEAPEEQKRLEMQKLNALLGFCESAGCRRQVLLRYFGDNGVPCGNCDTCRLPPETFDGTTSVQKALSCIYRTGQRFGSAYIIDVLLGVSNERIIRFGHDRQSTFGIGKEHSRQAWQSILRQALSYDLIRADMEAHGGLRLTERGADFLKRKDSIRLRLDTPALKGRPPRAKTVGIAAAALDADGQALFQRLKELRLRLARAQGLAPYMVFHDRTLIEFAAARPANLGALARVGGVGESKLKKYGDIFLREIHAAEALAEDAPN